MVIRQITIVTGAYKPTYNWGASPSWDVGIILGQTPTEKSVVSWQWILTVTIPQADDRCLDGPALGHGGVGGTIAKEKKLWLNGDLTWFSFIELWKMRPKMVYSLLRTWWSKHPNLHGNLRWVKLAIWGFWATKRRMAILNVRVMDWFSWEIMANQPDTLQKMTNSLLVSIPSRYSH